MSQNGGQKEVLVYPLSSRKGCTMSGRLPRGVSSPMKKTSPPALSGFSWSVSSACNYKTISTSTGLILKSKSLDQWGHLEKC